MNSTEATASLQKGETLDMFATTAGLIGVGYSSSKATANLGAAAHSRQPSTAALKKTSTTTRGAGRSRTRRSRSLTTETSGTAVSSSAQNRNSVDHMAAARRLRWTLRNAQSHSPEEVKAGRLICRHLLAMLDEAQLNSAPQNDSQYAAAKPSSNH